MQLLRCLSGGVRNAVIRFCDIALLVRVELHTQRFFFLFNYNTQLKRMGRSGGGELRGWFVEPLQAGENHLRRSRGWIG